MRNLGRLVVINISCDVKGLEGAIDEAILDGFVDNVKETVGSIHCKEHGKMPEITINGNSLDDLRINVTGCCNGVIQQVQSKLNLL
ncbi:hypothetical protein [Vibrio parahaemolyticus]|uniref:hypothetical protein n=1 Tax=Vibrio parahaemolyticus TaxID=670 RepID=UPI0011202C60|nr:hypothetical protein [Vibrio parahaemolyticus]HCG6989503.1 hypothetical protein [Vibrio parahaemolyticus]